MLRKTKEKHRLNHLLTTATYFMMDVQSGTEMNWLVFHWNLPAYGKYELQTADICERKVKFLSNITLRFRVDFAGLLLTPKNSLRNMESYLFRSCSFLIRRNSVLSQFSFSLFVDIHDWTEAKHDCKPFSAAAESPDAEETYSWLSPAWRWWGIACPEIVLLSRVV